jgi:hypothetical protein
MKIKMNIINRSMAVFAFACFAYSPAVRAVVPPPDGGYPNFTTAEGQNALFSLTSGAANTAVGWFSLNNVTAGSFNTGLGAGTLVLNIGDENTAIGAAALLLNTASGNTAVGSRALLNNTTGGTVANIQGIDVGPNVAFGQQALENNTVGSANTAVGYQTLHNFTTGPVGLEQIGASTAVGFQALAHATGAGAGNNGFGFQALFNNTDGAGNTAMGLSTMFVNTTGSSNVAVGNNALSSNTTGNTNTAVGFSALTGNIDGSNNTAIGFDALGGNTTGNDNIGLGEFAGSAVNSANHVICIGTTGANVDSSCYVGNIFGQPGGAQAVFVSADGKLGAQVSSRRFKEEISPIARASEALYALNPVSFRYTKEIDATGRPQFGLVAEDVAKVNPDLVIPDKEGRPYTVRYDQVNAMLLNEFLKARRQIDVQQKQIDALTAGLQKVSAQLEASKAEPQVVNNQ